MHQEQVAHWVRASLAVFKKSAAVPPPNVNRCHWTPRGEGGRTSLHVAMDGTFVWMHLKSRGQADFYVEVAHSRKIKNKSTSSEKCSLHSLQASTTHRTMYDEAHRRPGRYLEEVCEWNALRLYGILDSAAVDIEQPSSSSGFGMAENGIRMTTYAFNVKRL